MKIACLLADGFEDVEALATSALLRRAGFIVNFYSVYDQVKVIGSYQTEVTDLKPMSKLNIDDYQGLFIPGGQAVFKIRDDAAVKEIVSGFYKQDKWLLAICAGPTVFGLLGIMDYKHYVSFPGTEKEMGKAIRIEEKVVSDGKFITSRSAGTVYDFVFEIIKTIQGEASLLQFKQKIVY